MRATSLICCLYFIAALGSDSIAQEIKQIHFAKDRQYIYFFQSSRMSDTIISGKTDSFYYLVPDSIKPYVTLSSENAQFAVTRNDSILRCLYIPGMRYETYYQFVEQVPVLKNGVNGASVYQRDRILVQVLDKRTNKVIIENVYRVVP